MESLPLLVKGIIVGILVAAPMGPVNILCINRTVNRGRFDGLITGLGAALGDALFASIAAMGLTAAQTFVERHEFWFRLPGGLILLILAVVIWRRHPHIERRAPTSSGIVRSFVTTFFLTISNPITIAAFAALFVAWGLTTGFEVVAAGNVVLGVFVGSAIWWLILVSLIGILHGHIEDKHLELFNRGSASGVFLFGVYAIDSVTLRLFS